MDKAMKDKISILVFVLPSLLLFIIFMAIPIFSSVYISFLEWDGIGKATFAGLKNYVDLLIHNNDSFYLTVKNSLIFAGMSVFIQLPLALILALILAGGVKAENFFRTAYFMPVVISGVVIAALFSKIYNPDYGLLNKVLDSIGLGSLKRIWLADEHTALLCSFVPLIWQYIGYHMLLLYASIKQIPGEIFEAAKIDGASRFRAAVGIAIPLIMPMLEVCLIFAVIGSLKVFDLVYVLTNNGEPMGMTRVPTGLMYKELFSFNMYGLGSANAVFIVAECLVFTQLIRLFFKNRDFTF